MFNIITVQPNIVKLAIHVALGQKYVVSNGNNDNNGDNIRNGKNMNLLASKCGINKLIKRKEK